MLHKRYVARESVDKTAADAEIIVYDYLDGVSRVYQGMVCR